MQFTGGWNTSKIQQQFGGVIERVPHNWVMADDSGSKFTTATRSSLLEQLRGLGDDGSWLEFFDRYWRLLYNVARESGLGVADARDVVQQTVIKVSELMPDFEYERSKGSFRAWLRSLTRYRILEHRRRLAKVSREVPMDGWEGEVLPELEEVWDREWEENLTHAALVRVKAKVSPKDYQVFVCHVIDGWSARETARAVNASTGYVYVAKHRVAKLFEKEIKRLREEEF